MDPLTVTSQIASLVFTCMRATKALNDIKDKYRHAALLISSIQTECTVMSAALSQIQSNICTNLERTGAKMNQQQLSASFEIALLGCASTFAVLEEELKEMQGGEAGPSRMQRARYVWKEEIMNELLQQLRGQQGALQLLLIALHTESLTEVRDILRSNTEVLQNVLHRTKTNRRTRQARDSIVASSNLSYSSAITDTEFTFDDEVVNSRVYRRVLHAAARDAGMAGRGPAPNTARRRLSEAPTASDFESQADTIVPSGADSQSTVRRRGSDDASTLINPRRLSTELGRGTSSKKSKPKESRQYKYVQIPPPLPPRQKQPETCPHKAKIGCKLTAVSSCCSCSDKRPQESSYDVYKDGEGLVEDLRRWLNYCPTCVLYWQYGIETGYQQPKSPNTQATPPAVPLNPRRRFLGIFPRWRDTAPCPYASP